MLRIIAEQMEILREAQFRRFSERVLQHARIKGLSDRLPSTAQLDFTYDRLRFLRERTGLESEQHLVDLFILFLEKGDEFSNRTQVQRILDSEKFSPRRKYQRLKDLANERIQPAIP